MIIIVAIKVISYNSLRVPLRLLISHLLGCKCDSKGLLTLSLLNNRKLKQTGIFILPPIRWVESFDNTDKFEILCYAVDTNNDLCYMQRREVPRAKVIKGKHGLFFGDNTEDFKCFP